MNDLRIYTGSDDHAHFADVEVPTVQREIIAGIHPLGIAQPIPVSSVIFRHYLEQATREPDWHNAPLRQFAVADEDMAFEVSDARGDTSVRVPLSSL